MTLIPEICQNDKSNSSSTTIWESKNGIIPPKAKGPKSIPATTKPNISEIRNFEHSLPSSIAGITINRIPIIVWTTLISMTNLFSKLIVHGITKKRTKLSILKIRFR